MLKKEKGSFKSFEELDCWKACPNENYEEGRELISKALTILNGYINYLSRRKSQFTNNK